MIGVGITLPVLPVWTERLLLREGSSAGDVAMAVGLLTAVYPLSQLVSAPLWGHWSDRVGRRRLILLGLAGATIGQLLFATADALAVLYIARAVGGLLTAAIFPAAAAYVADSTTESERNRGMAWLGSAVSAGLVIGPALGGLLTRTEWSMTNARGETVVLSAFASPFVAAAALSLLGLVAALIWLKEPPRSQDVPGGARTTARALDVLRHGALRRLLVLAVSVQFALALFDATFALYAKRMWGLTPPQVGLAFMVCGVVMTVAQAGVIGRLSRVAGTTAQIAAGLVLVGGSLALLPFSRGMAALLSIIAAMAAGAALVTPNLATLLSARASSARGRMLGIQSAANSLGQFGGTVVGGALLGWNMEAPYVIAAALLLWFGATATAEAVRGSRA